jgi:ribose 5-phosphate isomerase A
MSPPDRAKINAAAASLDYVKEGMIVGLGTGSTANHFITMLGERTRKGFHIKGVPTSKASQALAESVGIPLIEIDQAEQIDVTIDGADEIDQYLNLVKGAGGALLREKIIANASRHMVVIADISKRVADFGAFLLPVEVTPFGFTLTARYVFEVLRATGCATAHVKLRETGSVGDPYITDNGNFLLDCACGHIPDAKATSLALNTIPGVVENGIFLAFPSSVRTVILGHETGVDVIEG